MYYGKRGNLSAISRRHFGSTRLELTFDAMLTISRAITIAHMRCRKSYLELDVKFMLEVQFVDAHPKSINNNLVASAFQ